jgi:hypothetical protein
MIELISVLAMFLGGCALLRTAGLRGWVLPGLGLVAGVALYIAIGVVQVVTPVVPTSPILTLALTAALPGAWWLWSLRRGRAVGVSAPLAGLSVAAVAGAVVLFRAVSLVTYHSDTFTYLMASRLLADDAYKTGISTYLVTNRVLGMPLLHAPANLVGDYYLQSISPLLALATVVTVVWFIHAGAARGLDRATRVVLIAAAVLLLVSNNRFVFNAFYLNGHLLQGALVLVVVGCGWLLATRAARDSTAPMMALQIVAIPGLLVTRPEGPLVTALALLPTWISDLPDRYRALTMAVAGGYGGAWFGFQAWVYADRGADLPVSVLGPLALSVGLLVGAGLIATGRLPRIAPPVDRWALWLAEIGLWLALFALAVREPGNLKQSVVGTERNILGGDGLWGLSLFILGLLVLAALAVRSPRREMLRFPLTTFVPLSFLLAYLREGAYHAGYGDSLNRMWMHVLPLAVLFVMVAAASVLKPKGEPTTSPGATDRGPVDATVHRGDLA